MTPLEYASTIAYSTKETLYLSYNIAKLFKDRSDVIFVECGVAAGAQVIAMAHAAPNVAIYAFDSFEGIPLPSNRDDQMPGIRFLTKEEMEALPDPGHQALASSFATVVSIEDFNEHIRKSGVSHNNIYAVKGWFEETTEGCLTEPQIAILRLDGDLYNSTYVCLKNLFELVIEGGFVIIDDYALKGCREACDDFFKGIGYTPEYCFVESKASKVAYFQKK